MTLTVPSCVPPPLSSILPLDPILPSIIAWPPNPIASLYPNDITGQTNGTIAVLPIPYSEARSIIPSQYPILSSAYASLLPGFPEDKYPLVIRNLLESSIEIFNIEATVDFQQVELRFPFIDLLGDGYSSFIYEKYDLIDAQALLAILGSSAYGEEVYPTFFTPEDRAYQYVNSSSPDEGISLVAYTNVSSTCPSVVNRFKRQAGIGPWPLEFYQNIANQPFFRDPEKGCGQQVAFFNTSLSNGVNAPKGLIGDVFIDAPFLPSARTFEDVHGVDIRYAFLEYNYVNCSSLKGV